MDNTVNLYGGMNVCSVPADSPEKIQGGQCQSTATNITG